MSKLFTKGNSKLSSKIATFSITAGMEVCGMECKGCYAMKEQQRWKNVRTSRDYKYLLSKSSQFVEEVEKELSKFKGKYVRIHASGEFYSQAYVDKWGEIAKKFPNLIFFAYTKKLDFDYPKLDNFIVHKSLIDVDGTRVMNYGSQDYIDNLAKQTQGFICPLVKDRTGKCGEDCTWCMDKSNENTPILFLQH